MEYKAKKSALSAFWFIMVSYLIKERRKSMKLNAPKQFTWIISCVLLVVAAILKFAVNAGDVAFWVAFVNGVLMLCATYFANL